MEMSHERQIYRGLLEDQEIELVNRDLTLGEREIEINRNESIQAQPNEEKPDQNSTSHEKKLKNEPIIMTFKKTITWALTTKVPAFCDEFSLGQLLKGIGSAFFGGRQTMVKAVFSMTSDEARYYQQRLLNGWIEQGKLAERIQHYGIDLWALANQQNIPLALYSSVIGVVWQYHHFSNNLQSRLLQRC